MTTQIVGLDGNNAPEIAEQGIPTRLLLGLVARANTYYQREPFNPEFGLGLPEALASPSIDRAVWRRRLDASFATLEGYEYVSGDVDLRGDTADLIVNIAIDQVLRRMTSTFASHYPSIDLDGLPEHRWNGLWASTAMQVLVDTISQILGDRVASRHWSDTALSMLPILAWEQSALAFDPQGTVQQQRNALRYNRELYTLQGTVAAFDLLMLLNGTEGFIRLVGDFDASGSRVRRVQGRRRGTHSLHTASPTLTDVDADGVNTPGFQPDGTQYHRQAAIDVILPVDRRGDISFADYISTAAQQVIPYTLEIVEVNIIAAYELDVTVGVNLIPADYWYLR